MFPAQTYSGDKLCIPWNGITKHMGCCSRAADREGMQPQLSEGMASLEKGPTAHRADRTNEELTEKAGPNKKGCKKPAEVMSTLHKPIELTLPCHNNSASAPQTLHTVSFAHFATTAKKKINSSSNLKRH